MFLPPAPSQSGGEDSISTPSGLNCRQSLNTGGPVLDIGLAGTKDRQKSLNDFINSDTDDVGAVGYMRIVIPLGSRPKRIDCSEIYRLELLRLKRELELLEAGIQ